MLHAGQAMRGQRQVGRIEADAVIGDLLLQGEAKGVATPLLAVVYTRLKAYENARAAG